MSKMRVVQVSHPNGPFELVERETPELGAGAVRIKVQACGSCHKRLSYRGLGHLGVQFAAKMGFKTVAIARRQDKEPLARELGAQHYIDSQAQDLAAELVKLGGARVILATVTNGEAMSAILGVWASVAS